VVILMRALMGLIKDNAARFQLLADVAKLTSTQVGT
jgi:hypothetical protein